tara:strand:+ start:29574 stop:29921 length:348 start_codon:yes stop_codon:yes gene_type:complete
MRTYKIRTETATVDIEETSTRRVLGSFTLEFLSDEIVCIKGLRGSGGILSALNENLIKVILSKYPSIKTVWFVMQPELFSRLEKLTGLNLEVMESTFVSDKKALLVKLNLALESK